MQLYKHRNYTVVFLIISVLYYFLSINLLQKYVAGDQGRYVFLWNAYKNASYGDIMYLGALVTNGSEPLSLGLLWLGAKIGFEHIYYISFLNSVLVYGVLLVLKKYEYSFWSYIFLLSNFYLIVLMTGAERLKIAYIFLVYSFYFTGRLKYFLLILTPLAHLQSLILLPTFFLVKNYNLLRDLFGRMVINVRVLISGIGLGVVVGYILYYFYEPIVDNVYRRMIFMSSISSYLPFIALYISSIFVVQNRVRLIIAITPLLLATFIIGGSRMNMITFTAIIILVGYENKYKLYYLYPIFIYLSYKSIGFIKNIYVYGNGFYNM